MAQTRTQRAAILVKSGENPKFELRNVAIPAYGPNDVLIRLSVTSICGSDYGLALGRMGQTREVLGHEGVGRVVELGSNVPSLDTELKVGQRVGLAWNRDVCGQCTFCMDPNHADQGEGRCGAKLFSGVVADGTFAEFAVAPLRYLIRLPSDLDNVSDEDVVPIMCGGVTAYKAVKSCGLVPGQFVAVVGTGGVGLLALQYAKAMGYRTIGIDVNADKGRLAREAAQVDHYVDISQVPKPAEGQPGDTPFSSPVGDAVKKLTPGGLGAAAVVIASGAAAAYQSAFGMLAPFGVYMAVGLVPLDKTVSFHPTALVAHGWQLKGSAVGSRGDILEALDFVRRGLVKPLTRPAKFEDIDQLVTNVGKAQVEGKYVIRLDGPESSDGGVKA